MDNDNALMVFLVGVVACGMGWLFGASYVAETCVSYVELREMRIVHYNPQNGELVWNHNDKPVKK